MCEQVPLKVFKSSVGRMVGQSPVFGTEQLGMMNCNVTVLPEERWPRARKRPHSTEPAIDKLRREDRPMGMVVEVDTDIDSRDPAKHQGRSQDEGDPGPKAGDAGYSRMPIQPKRASIRGKAKDMKDNAVPVLRMGEKAPAPQLRRCSGQSGNHNCLRTAAIATTVTPRLTQGPQTAAPAIMAIAKSGKNDLPKTRPVGDKSVCDGRSMLRSFPLRLIAAITQIC